MLKHRVLPLSLYNISTDIMTVYNEKSTEEIQCFFAPELGLEPRTL